MRDDVLQIPEHLRDALWKVESARIEPVAAEGLVVCGLGGSAIGADLARAVLGPRLTRPLLTVRGYELPAWLGAGWTGLFSSYSGDTEETLACHEEAGSRGLRRISATTGGKLGESARAAGEPVIGLPGILPQPRAAVGYMLVVALEMAAAAGAGPRVAGEIESAAGWLGGELDRLQARSAEVVAEVADRTPVILGAGLTAPVARRWKGQLNENSKRHAFFSELPEACHNEVVAWGTENASSDLHAILLADRDQHPRERRRIEILASMIAEAGGSAQIVETEGDSRTARLMWAVMLGDLVSIDLAERHGTDPEPVPPIDRLKAELG